MSDTLFEVKDFNSHIETQLKVIRPKGYLIPKSDDGLKSFLAKHHIQFSDFVLKDDEKVIRYNILGKSKKTEEEDEHIAPQVQEEMFFNNSYDEYWYIPLNQITSNLLVTALEPQSMLGLVQYKEYEYLLENQFYPILKVMESK